MELTDIEKHRGELQAEQNRLRYTCPFPTADAIAARNARLGEIDSELEALQAVPAEQIGMASDQRLVLAHNLGTVTPVPEPPLEDEQSQHRSSTHPRHGGSGWDWEDES